MPAAAGAASWTCAACTFENSNGAAEVCDMCGCQRPGVRGDGSARVDGAARAKVAADAKIVPDKASGSGQSYSCVMVGSM